MMAWRCQQLHDLLQNSVTFELSISKPRQKTSSVIYVSKPPPQWRCHSFPKPVPVLTRCYQYWANSGPVLTHFGMFIGMRVFDRGLIVGIRHINPKDWVGIDTVEKGQVCHQNDGDAWSHVNWTHKNIERHTADTIVSWLNPKQWVIVHTSDLMMIIRQSIYILSIITREMGKLKTYSPTYCIMDNGKNMLNLTHTLDKIYLTGIL